MFGNSSEWMRVTTVTPQAARVEHVGLVDAGHARLAAWKPARAIRSISGTV
jgi:hypothetical protein